MARLIKPSILILLCICMYGCKTDSNNIKSQNENLDSDHEKQIYINEKIAAAINNGDTSAYDMVHDYLAFESVDKHKLFHVAFMMANKYNYHKANFDVFNILTSDISFNDINLKLKDDFSNKLSNYYLMKYYNSLPEKDKRKSILEDYFNTNKKLPTLKEILCE